LIDAGLPKKKKKNLADVGLPKFGNRLAALQTQIQHSLEDHKFIGTSKKEKQHHMT
jgi:hypothetical protein